MNEKRPEYTPEAAAYDACREAVVFLLDLIRSDLEAGDAATRGGGQRPDWGDVDVLLKVRGHLVLAACEIANRTPMDVECLIEEGA